MNRSKSVLNKNSKLDSNPLNEINNEEPNDNLTQTKTDLPKLKTLYGKKSPYSLKINKIIDELSKIDPDSLMKQVDPTINSTKTIKQIQAYYNNIKKEIGTYIRQERIEEQLKKEINRIPKQIEMLVHPPKTSTSLFNEIKPNKENKDKDKNKE